MTLSMSRRLVLAAVLLTAGIAPAIAQTNIRFAAVFSERDIRARMIEMLAKEVEKDFKIEPFYNGTLFKQGTELVALQRDNLELGNIAPQDISKQIPAWSILTAAYVFRDANHLQAFWNSPTRRRDEKNGRGSGQGENPRADILRHPAGRSEAQEEDQHPGGPGRHQAAHAARRCVANAWQLARRQSDADGVRRDLYRPADRRGRRAGQPASERSGDEVQRSDVADRAHLAPHRLRPADHQPEDLERHVAGQAKVLPGRGRQGAQVQRGRASQARSRARRRDEEGGSRGLHARCRGLPRPRARNSTSRPIRPRTGRRACSRRSAP